MVSNLVLRKDWFCTDFNDLQQAEVLEAGIRTYYPLDCESPLLEELGQFKSNSVLLCSFCPLIHLHRLEQVCRFSIFDFLRFLQVFVCFLLDLFKSSVMSQSIWGFPDVSSLRIFRLLGLFRGTFHECCFCTIFFRDLNRVVMKELLGFNTCYTFSLEWGCITLG